MVTLFNVKTSIAGGHLEIGESWEECVVRETREETGYEISVEQAQFLHTTNDVFQAEKKHYVTIFMQGQFCCKFSVLINWNAPIHKIVGT